MKSPLAWLAVFAFWVLSAHASTISYSDSGTFTSSTPSSAFTAPSETWAFAFQADTSPTLLESDPSGFNLAFSDFTYSLDGSPIAITPTLIRFWSATAGGGWMICFDGTSPCTDGFSTGGAGPQMYSGTTSAPTLLPGAFTSDEFAVFESTTLLYVQPNTTVQAAAIPEPSTLVTLAAALLLLLLGGQRLHLRS
ncbi:MAG TPA: hypothetical protein VK335_11175 [Bryobacteraceae bacterium]|nr:hypothetical protein [Bryobacteraceae bacterium]